MKDPEARGCVFVCVGSLLGGIGGYIFGLMYNSGSDASLVQEMAIYVVGGGIAGFVLGVTLAILSFARSDGSRRPVVHVIIVVGFMVFLVRLAMIILAGR